MIIHCIGKRLESQDLLDTGHSYVDTCLLYSLCHLNSLQTICELESSSQDDSRDEGKHDGRLLSAKYHMLLINVGMAYSFLVTEFEREVVWLLTSLIW